MLKIGPFAMNIMKDKERVFILYSLWIFKHTLLFIQGLFRDRGKRQMVFKHYLKNAE